MPHARSHLVAEDSEAFLQGQLEPVPDCDTVSCPVVKVLVGDHAENVLVVHVCGSVRVSKHVGRVEDVQSFVLHGSLTWTQTQSGWVIKSK